MTQALDLRLFWRKQNAFIYNAPVISSVNSRDNNLDAAQPRCIHDLLEAQAQQNPDAIAITAPGRLPLTYAGLREQVEEVKRDLNSMGLGRNDRVGIVVPNGPEMAVAFMAVAACATCAPLNPEYRADEFDFYLSGIKARALIIQTGLSSPALAVARARGVSIIELSPVLSAEAGRFTLTGKGRSHAAEDGFARPEDTALLLHTSGTTSLPRIVPLTQTNICAQARNNQVTLALTGDDRCLNIMPMFHSTGLVGVTLASLMSGASIVCAPGFYAPRFFEWVETFRPTWYTAVPSMHQAILTRAASNREIIEGCPLRFIRSSSSALSAQVLAELENAFKAVVIESYGMTESGMITCNPLPPRKRKAGSAGVPAGPEVAVMNERDDLLPAGETGEIVIRGDSLMQGYENETAANQLAFTGGWFRTGDQGYVDDDGYLFITGRLKEIINRGGEKISPREVEEALLEHAAVAQAVAFAVPDNKLGESVGAALVLRKDSGVTEKEIRNFAASRLADFKVPGLVIIVDEIPKGPFGKLRRIGLAERLGIRESTQQSHESQAEFVPPGTPQEALLAEIWARVLGVDRVGINDNFIQLGGDSILATQIISQVREVMQVELSAISLFEAPTVADMIKSIETARQVARGRPISSIQPIRRASTRGNNSTGEQ
jgi:acyl-CoA synthetase (AMP-forming)/AMP-acid ligase II/acyl carrier protein